MTKHKLVRDRIPEIIEATGQKPKLQVCNSQWAFKIHLQNKLFEEIKEFLEADLLDREAAKEELADILEVIDALITAGWAKEQILQAQKEKAESHGRFHGRWILETPDN